jgi:hypothetical protein
MQQEEQAKDQQGANGAASAIALPAMSSFPSVVSIPFFLCSYLPIALSFIGSFRPTACRSRAPPEGASPRVQGQPTRLQGSLKQLKVRGTFGRRAYAAVAEAPSGAPTVVTNDVRVMASSRSW